MNNKYISQIDSDEFSFLKSVGGILGICEATAPCLVFVLIYVVHQSLTSALIMSLIVTCVLTCVRMYKKGSYTQILAGLVLTAISVLWAWKSGRAENFFALGLWINAVYALIFFLSLCLRYPLISLLVLGVKGKFSSQWRTAYRRIYRQGYYSSALWCGLFLIRLAVEVPLYYMHLVTALGVARIILGIPFFAVVAWITWVLMKDTLSELSETSIPSDDQISSANDLGGNALDGADT